MQTHGSQTISTHVPPVRRLAITTFILIAFAVAVLSVGGARPAAAQGERPAGGALVLDVPSHVVDELAAVVRGTSKSGVDVSHPELELGYKLCGTDSCLCIDVEPEECIPERSQNRSSWITLSPSTRTPAVLDMAARELQSGKYLVVKLCSTQQWLHEGCLILSPDKD